MTTLTTPTPESPDRGPTRSLVWLIAGSFLAGILALVLVLVLVVVIRPLGWRLAAVGVLWFPGVAALILFSDALDQALSPHPRAWAPEALHWFSASFVALTVAVVAGAFFPSALGLSASPSFGAAVGCDLLIGVVAGLLTLLITAVSGWVGGRMVYGVRRLKWSGEECPEKFLLPLRDEWSWPDAIRTVVLPVAGVLLSAGVTALTAVPAKTAAPAADTTPAVPSVLGSIVLPLVMWFVATALVWVAFDLVGRQIRRRHGDTGPARPVPRRRRRATHASALAIGLAIALGWSFAWVLDDLIQGSLANHGTPSGVSIQAVPPAQQVAYLAQSFVPRFELAQGERWEPTTVDWYVGHAQLTTSREFCVPSSTTEPQGCRVLCAVTKGSECAPVCDDPDPGACAPAGGAPHAVYYLYRDATNTPSTDHPARPGHDWAVIEYWIFYRYDSLNAGLITQWHQSDWEQVSVLLERKGTTVSPVEVGFSEHCYGTALPATEVSWNGSHPVSFVGLGSHANYPTENDVPIRQLQCLTRQTPRYLGAAGLFFNPRVAGWSLELPIAYLIGLRDQTDHPRTIADAQAISQRSTPSIWDFHGYWGVDNSLEVVTGGVPTGAGPQSPQDQNPAKKPFGDMLCSSKWLRPSPTPATAWVCSS